MAGSFVEVPKCSFCAYCLIRNMPAYNIRLSNLQQPPIYALHRDQRLASSAATSAAVAIARHNPMQQAGGGGARRLCTLTSVLTTGGGGGRPRSGGGGRPRSPDGERVRCSLRRRLSASASGLRLLAPQHPHHCWSSTISAGFTSERYFTQ